MLKKVIKLNNEGSLVVGLPASFARELGITREDYLNVEIVGKCLHVNKVKIE